MALLKFGLQGVVLLAGIVISYFPGTMAASNGQAEGLPSHMGPTGSLGMMGDGLMMPPMDPSRGRVLFASKGCVVCHSVNGVGGEDVTAFDASAMPSLMNPFEFSARMWRGAEAMIFLQREEMGGQIEFTGQDLADIVAFVHHPAEQAKFTMDDIPSNIKKMMRHSGEEGHETTGEGDQDDKAFHGQRENHD